MIKDLKKDTESKMQKALDATRREMAEVRTGRAHPGLVEGLRVDYYGTPTVLKQMASITVPDPRTIMIQPWDPSAVTEIEKAIANNPKIGMTPSHDGKVLRLNVPQLSKERREELTKVAKQMAEHGRISLRTIRREANDRLKKLQSDEHISEDEVFRGQEDIQKITDQYIKEVDDAMDKKLKELVEI
ncbi:MAG: ribosome recycling factor [Candidatus Omnitrophota bacterium]